MNRSLTEQEIRAARAAVERSKAAPREPVDHGDAAGRFEAAESVESSAAELWEQFRPAKGLPPRP